ncbi:MAG: hypothetical protein ABIN37_14460 [Burkholderiaceae bacterium]
MVANARVAPRFVPTLTEVVQAPARLVATISPVAPPAPVLSRTPSPAAPIDGDALVEWIQAEVADSLHRNLHELIATALVEQIDAVAARLQNDIEPMLRRAVQEAVASEAAARTLD